MLAEAVAEREEVVLAVVALALADRAVEARVEALDAWSPATRGRFGLCSPRSDSRRRRAAASSFRSELSIL